LIEFWPDHCWRKKTAKAMNMRIRLPGLAVSFQEVPEVLAFSSSMAAQISLNSSTT